MTDLTCPECTSTEVYRSRRRSLVDYFLAVFGLYPYRCSVCLKRWRHFGNLKSQPE